MTRLTWHGHNATHTRHINLSITVHGHFNLCITVLDIEPRGALTFARTPARSGYADNFLAAAAKSYLNPLPILTGSRRNSRQPVGPKEPGTGYSPAFASPVTTSPKGA